MKQCPKCNQVYADDNLNFCLTDGASLLATDDSEPTLVLFSPSLNTPSTISSPSQPRQPARQGVSPLFAYAAVGLLSLFIGGGIMMWFKSDAKPSSTESQNTTPSNTASISQNLNQVKEESNINRNEVTPRRNQTEKPMPQASPNTAKLYRVVGVAYNDVLYIRPKPGQLDLYAAKSMILQGCVRCMAEADGES